MTFWLIIVAVIVLGYFAFSVYRHDDTLFSKMTGYTYFDVLLDSRVRVMNKLFNTLDAVDGSHKVLVDLVVPNGGATQTVDGLLIHASGIYVINGKQMSGWINGREQDSQWTQLLHGDKQRVFENPIYDVKRGIYTLQEHLPEINADVYEAVVLFTDNCSFQQIELESTNIDVLKTKDLKGWIKTLDGEVLSESEIEIIYNVLEAMVQKKNVKLVKKEKITSIS